MTTPDMHAALGRLVNNEQTRKQEKIDQSLPKRSSREAELSPRGAAPRLVKRQRPPAIAAPPPSPADAWPVPAPAPEKRTRSGKPPLAFPPSPGQSPRHASPDSVMDTLSTSFLRSCSTDALPVPKEAPERPAARRRTLDGYGQFLFLDDDAPHPPCAMGPGLPEPPRERSHTA